jgi:hypothetical protein
MAAAGFPARAIIIANTPKWSRADLPYSGVLPTMTHGAKMTSLWLMPTFR